MSPLAVAAWPTFSWVQAWVRGWGRGGPCANAKVGAAEEQASKRARRFRSAYRAGRASPDPVECVDCSEPFESLREGAECAATGLIETGVRNGKVVVRTGLCGGAVALVGGARLVAFLLAPRGGRARLFHMALPLVAGGGGGFLPSAGDGDGDDDGNGKAAWPAVGTRVWGSAGLDLCPCVIALREKAPLASACCKLALRPSVSAVRLPGSVDPRTRLDLAATGLSLLVRRSAPASPPVTRSVNTRLLQARRAGTAQPRTEATSHGRMAAGTPTHHPGPRSRQASAEGQ